MSRMINKLLHKKKPQQQVSFSDVVEAREYNESGAATPGDHTFSDALLAMPTPIPPQGYAMSIHAAASLDVYDLVEAYIYNWGVDPNIGNKYGWTPLMYAAQCGNYEVCRMLLHYGARLDLKNQSGKTAMDLARSWGHSRVLGLFYGKMKTEMADSLAVRTSPTQVFVASIKTSNAAALMQERMRICDQLWAAGIRAETSYNANPKLLEQFQFCEYENNQVPWLVMVADEEMAKASVKLRCVATREETLVKLADLVPVLLEKLGGQN